MNFDHFIMPCISKQKQGHRRPARASVLRSLAAAPSERRCLCHCRRLAPSWKSPRFPVRLPSRGIGLVGRGPSPKPASPGRSHTQHTQSGDWGKCGTEVAVRARERAEVLWTCRFRELPQPPRERGRESRDGSDSSSDSRDSEAIGCGVAGGEPGLRQGRGGHDAGDGQGARRGGEAVGRRG